MRMFLALMLFAATARAEDVTFLLYPPLAYVDDTAIPDGRVYSTWVECSYDNGASFFHVADPAPSAPPIKVVVTFRDTPWTYICHAKVYMADATRTASPWSDPLTVVIPQAQAVTPSSLTQVEAH